MTSIDMAEALFASYLQPSDHPTSAQVTAVVRDSLRRLGGPGGGAAVCATPYGGHPATAAERMRWALATTKHARARRASSRPRHQDLRAIPGHLRVIG
jgi:hypothetical protein